MNSRSSVNETNLVNFSADIPTLNQLETKDGLLSFPFDHIYACHSESSEGGRREALHLEKEVEITSQCAEQAAPAGTAELSRLAGRLAATDKQNKKLKELLIFHLDLIQQQNASDRLTAAETQNKRLKELLIYHHDLIQQQNDAITKREKLFQALKQENETLKSKLYRMDKRVLQSQRHSSNAVPLMQVGGVGPTAIKTETTTSSQIMLNSLELLIPDSSTNSCLFDNDIKTNNFVQDSLDRRTNSDRVGSVSTYIPADLGIPTLENKSLNIKDYTMIESKRTFKKELKTDTRADALYTVTGNSANPVIQRIQRSRRRTASSTAPVNRAAKAPTVKTEAKPETITSPYEEDKMFDRFTVNKKSKMINTYGKSTRNGNPKKTIAFTGSLSDRLQLIDTTPTGEDPYQLGEADMREQSPIPKLMLQKTNQGRMKICSTDTNSPSTNRRLHTALDDEDKGMEKIKLNRYNLTNTYMHHSEIKKEDPDIDDSDLDFVKTEAEIDWRLYSTKPGTQTSVCDFSYGETPNNLASNMLPALVEFKDLYKGGSGAYQSEHNQFPAYKSPNDKGNRRAGRTTSLVVPTSTPDDGMPKPQVKPSRKRALSTTGLLKSLKRENLPKVAVKPKPIKGKAACRGKKSPLPGVETQRPYHTLVGDPDVSWYLGLDPDVKIEDVDQPGAASLESTVEVPRWREKPYTSTYTLEGTENLDDKVFEKRHQKLEAEERRQLRWHMRRIREQRHVERLRQRQRDSWCAASAHAHQPATFTVWPRPLSDLKYLEITDTLPVNAFGEPVPAVPRADFVLPWVRTSKALKRSKRSKTLH